jgi:hypothetical protein
LTECVFFSASLGGGIPCTSFAAFMPSSTRSRIARGPNQACNTFSASLLMLPVNCSLFLQTILGFCCRRDTIAIKKSWCPASRSARWALGSASQGQTGASAQSARGRRSSNDIRKVPPDGARPRKSRSAERAALPRDKYFHQLCRRALDFGSDVATFPTAIFIRSFCPLSACLALTRVGLWSWRFGREP